MSILIICAAAFACVVEAAATASCHADVEACHATGGAALLQLGGSVGRRETRSVDEDEEVSTGAAASTGSTAEKKPKKGGFDFGGGNNDDNLNMGSKNNNDNLNMNNNVDDAELAKESKNDNLNDLEKEETNKKKKHGDKKDNDDASFNFNNDETESDDEKASPGGPKKAVDRVDNFDFGEGPVKTEDEKVTAGVDKATEGIKKQVREAITKVLKEEAGIEVAIHEAVAKLGVGSAEEKKFAEAVKSTLEDAQAKVKAAQEQLQKLKEDMGPPSASYMGCFPHAWLLAVACSWWLSRL